MLEFSSYRRQRLATRTRPGTPVDYPLARARSEAPVGSTWGQRVSTVVAMIGIITLFVLFFSESARAWWQVPNSGKPDSSRTTPQAKQLSPQIQPGDKAAPPPEPESSPAPSARRRTSVSALLQRLRENQSAHRTMAATLEWICESQPEEWISLLQAGRQSLPERHRDWVEKIVMARLAEVDIDCARAAAEVISSGRYGSDHPLNEVYIAWAASDPSAAFEHYFHDGRFQILDQTATFRAMTEQLLSEHPTSASQMTVDLLRSKSSFNRADGQVALEVLIDHALRSGGVPAAEKLLRGLPMEIGLDHGWCHLAERMTATQPAVAQRILQSLDPGAIPPETLHKLAGQLCAIDSSRARDWANALADPTQRNIAASAVIEWLAENAQGGTAEAWLKQLPYSPELEGAYLHFAREHSDDNPERALQWAARIPAQSFAWQLLEYHLRNKVESHPEWRTYIPPRVLQKWELLAEIDRLEGRPP